MISLNDIQNNWRLLDRTGDIEVDGVKLLSHEKFTKVESFEVAFIPPWKAIRVLGVLPQVFWLVYAFQLLLKCDKHSVLIVNGGLPIWLYAGLLNRFLPRRRRILCWDVFVEVDQRWKRRLFQTAIRGISLSVLWSKAQVATHAKFLGVSEDKFIFLPFKSNHSKNHRYHLSLGNFVFAGGNGKRDYRCLIEAVRGTDIPVIISATDPKVRRTIELLPNIIVLGAPEPAFAQLQAAAKFVVIPMTYTGLKGGGEANFCNAMWHGKPVIAADRIAATDYIIEGETGYVVPSGDSKQLRDRILELWNDESKVKLMGEKARRHCETYFTHSMFIRRLLTVAQMIGQEYGKAKP